MAQCPLCLNEQATCEQISDGFGEKAVTVSFSPIIYLVTCPDCSEYKITDDAIWFLERSDERRQRAMTYIRKHHLISRHAAAREGNILTIDSDMLNAYWRSGDTLSTVHQNC